MNTSPTVVNDVVFVNSNDNKTYALNATEGALIWRYATRGRLDSSPTVAGGVVFTCSADHNVYALNATNGDLLSCFSFVSEVNPVLALFEPSKHGPRLGFSGCIFR